MSFKKFCALSGAKGMVNKMKKKFGVIGCGVVGAALAFLLGKEDFELQGIADINPVALNKIKQLLPRASVLPLEKIFDLAQIIFISTNDSAIEAVVEQALATGIIKPEHSIIHLSGAHSSKLMQEASAAGAKVLSIHPLQSFASLKMAIKNLPGSVFSIEGDEQAHELAIEIVNSLKGEYFFITATAKPLYHAAACVVSNYMVTLIDLGLKLFASSGIPPNLALKAITPLVNGTINNIANLGIPNALTGPIARGDNSTIIKHLGCLEENRPELINLYSCLGWYTAIVAKDKGGIDAETMQDIQKIFKQELKF